MVVCHDLVEIEAGDMPRPHKLDAEKKKKAEQEAMKKIVSLLPKPIGARIESIWQEFEKGSTTEAKLVHALDKIEVATQHNEADISIWDKKAGEFGLNLHGADKAAHALRITHTLNNLVYKKTKSKIEDAGLDVSLFENEWKQKKDTF